MANRNFQEENIEKATKVIEFFSDNEELITFYNKDLEKLVMENISKEIGTALSNLMGIDMNGKCFSSKIISSIAKETKVVETGEIPYAIIDMCTSPEFSKLFDDTDTHEADEAYALLSQYFLALELKKNNEEYKAIFTKHREEERTASEKFISEHNSKMGFEDIVIETA